VHGIIGSGYVGGAMREVMGGIAYDIDPDRSDVSTIAELVSMVEVIFVSVPTPMAEDGSCDTSIVEQVIDEVRKYAPEMPIAVRSTVPPGTCERLGVVFNPEFLNQRNAVHDFQNSDRIILGGDNGEFRLIYRRYFNCPILAMTTTEAELVKYGANIAGATRVAFANEIWQVAQAFHADYSIVAKVLAHDKRLGYCHWQVPGPDGLLGFGGACFPKDINAWIALSRSLGLNPTVSEGAWSKCQELRHE
jgi:UDPglucose 6-dehydrogenase